MNLETYMVRRLVTICSNAEASHLDITSEVLTMVLAQATEVVNDVRAKIKGAIGVLPPMPDVAVKYKDVRIRVSVDTSPWNDVKPEEERSEWDIDEEDEELDE